MNGNKNLKKLQERKREVVLDYDYSKNTLCDIKNVQKVN
jgi:hypothetical protein